MSKGGTLQLLQFFHFIETYDELHVIPIFAAITVHEEVVDLVVEVPQLERNDVVPADIL